jgi:uncharacterized membrane protein
VDSETRRAGLLLAAIAAVGVLISLYLTWTKLSGTPAVCGPLGGCETVEASDYSQILGIPTAAFGIGYSGVMTLLGLAWWRAGDRRALLAGYALGLAGILVEIFLVYLQLFVIHAICVWCMGYGLTIVLGWLVAVVALRRSPA